MQISYLPQPSTSIDLFAINKLRYFDQPRPLIVNFEVLIQPAFRKLRPKTDSKIKVNWKNTINSLGARVCSTGGNTHSRTFSNCNVTLLHGKMQEDAARAKLWC